MKQECIQIVGLELPKDLFNASSNILLREFIKNRLVRSVGNPAVQGRNLGFNDASNLPIHTVVVSFPQGKYPGFGHKDNPISATTREFADDSLSFPRAVEARNIKVCYALIESFL